MFNYGQLSVQYSLFIYIKGLDVVFKNSMGKGGITYQSSFEAAVKDLNIPLNINCIFSLIDFLFEGGHFSFVGNSADFKLTYLTQASVLHAGLTNNQIKPVGTFVVGDTSTGKTELIYSVAKLFPESIKVNLASMSSKALIYSCIDDPRYLNGKIILVEELTGLDDPDLQYLLRVLVTKGRASHYTVIGGQAHQIEIIGSISLQSTGLPKDSLREDTMNRMVRLSTDNSPVQTKAVLNRIKLSYIKEKPISGKHSKIENLFHDYFLSLEPFEVSIPFAGKILFDTSKADQRRKAKIFLDLLATVCVLNQHKRNIKNGVLQAEEEDFHTLIGITTKTSHCSDSSFSKAEKIVFNSIKKDLNDKYFSTDEIASLKPGGYGRTTLKTSISSLVEKGILNRKVVKRKAHFCIKKKTLLVNDWGVEDFLS